jgi:hypothetical protein
MCLNTHKKAIEIVGYNNPNFNNICWSNISANPSDEAMELLEKNHTKIDSDNLSLNPNDKAIKLLEKYPDKINYDNLSLNTNGKALVLIVDKCPQKINWENVRKNKNVEKSIDLLLDYKKTDKWPSILNNKYVSYLENNELDTIQWEVLAEKMITNPCERGISLIVKHHAIIYTQYSNKNKYMENVSLINDFFSFRLSVVFPDPGLPIILIFLILFFFIKSNNFKYFSLSRLFFISSISLFRLSKYRVRSALWTSK